MRLSTVFAILASVLLVMCVLVGFASFGLDGNGEYAPMGVRANALPELSSLNTNPSSIVDNADASVTFSADATDSDGWSPWQRLGPFRLGGDA